MRDHPGTTLEFIPAVGQFSEDTFGLMAAMSAAADRPLNWNLLQVYAQNWDLVQHQLSGYDYAAERGGTVIALTLPDSFRLRLNLRSGFVLDILDGWDRLMALPDAEKLAMLRDPAGRAEMDRLAQSTEGPMRAIGNWGAYVLLETFTDEYRQFQGRTLGDIAAELGRTPWDTLADIAIADGLTTVIANQDRGQDEASWARRVEVWRDGRAVVGASDAGAHLDMIDSFSFSTTLLARAVREREPAADRGGRALPHRQPGAAVRPASIAAGWRSARMPTWSCSIRPPSGRARCTPGSTCPEGRVASTATRSASATSSSTASPSCTAGTCWTGVRAPCCGPAGTRRRSPWPTPARGVPARGPDRPADHPDVTRSPTVFARGVSRWARSYPLAPRYRPPRPPCGCGRRMAPRWPRSGSPDPTTPSPRWSWCTASPTGPGAARSTAS